jgi:hypothetical protein
MHHVQEVFGSVKKHNFKFYLNKCRFFHTWVEYLGHIIYPNGLGVQKVKVETISQVPQPTYVNILWAFLGLCNFSIGLLKGSIQLWSFDPINKDWLWYGAKHKSKFFKS